MRYRVTRIGYDRRGIGSAVRVVQRIMTTAGTSRHIAWILAHCTRLGVFFICAVVPR